MNVIGYSYNLLLNCFFVSLTLRDAHFVNHHFYERHHQNDRFEVTRKLELRKPWTYSTALKGKKMEDHVKSGKSRAQRVAEKCKNDMRSVKKWRKRGNSSYQRRPELACRMLLRSSRRDRLQGTASRPSFKPAFGHENSIRGKWWWTEYWRLSAGKRGRR